MLIMDKKNYRLISARKEMGLTQEQLAVLLNCKKGTVSNWENGYSIPRLPDAFRLSQILKKNIEYLFFDVNVQETYTEDVEYSSQVENEPALAKLFDGNLC